MNEMQRMRIYQKFNRQNELLLASLRSVVTCKTQLHVFYNRLDFPSVTQTFIHHYPQDLFMPVVEPMDKIREMGDRMKNAKSIAQMDAIINEWVETQDEMLQSIEESASWHWGKAIEFKFTGIKASDRAHVATHVQFKKAGGFLLHWIDEVKAPLKEVVLVALQGEQGPALRYATIVNRLN